MKMKADTEIKKGTKVEFYINQVSCLTDKGIVKSISTKSARVETSDGLKTVKLVDMWAVRR